MAKFSIASPTRTSAKESVSNMYSLANAVAVNNVANKKNGVCEDLA